MEVLPFPACPYTPAYGYTSPQVSSVIVHHLTVIVPHSFFFNQGISWLLLFDVVGRRHCSPSYPPSLPKAKVHRFLLHAGLLFYFVSPEVIPQPYKNAHLSSCSFVYLSGVFGGHSTHDGRSLFPRPTPRSLLTVHAHSFLSISVFSALSSYGL